MLQAIEKDIEARRSKLTEAAASLSELIDRAAASGPFRVDQLSTSLSDFGQSVKAQHFHVTQARSLSECIATEASDVSGRLGSAQKRLLAVQVTSPTVAGLQEQMSEHNVCRQSVQARSQPLPVSSPAPQCSHCTRFAELPVPQS